MARLKLKYQSIYFFRYKAKLADLKKIPVYDQAPLVIFLDLDYRARKGKVLGINIHWIPPKYRKFFIDTVIKIFQDQKMNGRRAPRLFYNQVKYDITLRKIALKAIRLYFLNRMTNVTEVPFEFWDQVLGVKRFRSRFAYKRRNYKH